MFSILRHFCIKITIRYTDNYEQDCDIFIQNKQTPQTKNYRPKLTSKK